MSSFYLLSYKSVPLGIYNKLHYLFDYILEQLRFPDKNIDLTKIEINHFTVNIGYPSSSLCFRLDNRVYLEETNGKRVEMCSDTFSRFKKIQKYYETKIKNVTARKEKNKVTEPVEPVEPVKPVKIYTEEEKKEIEEKQKQVNEEQKKTIYEMNRLKRQLKLVNKWTTKFKTDLDLYKKFQDNKKEDEEFEIPEMFEETWNFFNDFENPDESFTEYFMTFNMDSELDINELEELLGETIEDDSENEDSDDEQ